ncbi:pyroglutamyl-peptidase I [Desmospora profundinema]|uniref:Pyrrolidone-carboxylate peptidase n=1 Tax=Desmospora profundinema TaxID=1571184 RepID=A0ABU1IS17_9BACL|nr:pyroglutamyl-peptidase I [Desmospora profundinema]MDR6227591.1 pyroglutamyl-peptidase [Desmospora profundinema]
MKKVLLTGFELFGGERVNPSWEAVRSLKGEKVEGAAIEGVCLPTVFGKSLNRLRQAIRDTQPDVVIAVGQAGGRAGITPERVAINLEDARIPDNEGNQPVDQPVVKGAPAAYWSTLPIKRMVRALREEGIPASVSHTAGTYVCNHVFFGLMHELEQACRPMRGGFIHIPFAPSQVSDGDHPSLPLEIVRQGLLLAVRESRHVTDIRETGGAVH